MVQCDQKWVFVNSSPTEQITKSARLDIQVESDTSYSFCVIHNIYDELHFFSLLTKIRLCDQNALQRCCVDQIKASM